MGRLNCLHRHLAVVETGGLCEVCKVRPVVLLLMDPPNGPIKYYCGICGLATLLTDIKNAGISLDEITMAFPTLSAVVDAPLRNLLVQ